MEHVLKKRGKRPSKTTEDDLKKMKLDLKKIKWKTTSTIMKDKLKT
jgi:hypothetical protein